MDEFKYGDYCYNYYNRWRSENNTYRFRQGSVPGIHHYSAGGRYCGGYRNPPHRYEETNKYIADEDDQRILTNLQVYHLEKYRWVPDPWDDIRRSRQGHSWKNYRKTQYK